MRMLLSLIFMFLFYGINAQGPWVYGAGHGYSHISIGVLPTYDSVFEGNINNLTDLEGEISEFSIQSYSEVGLGKKFGVILSLPYNIISSTLDAPTSSGRVAGSLSGFGNTEIGLKYNFINNPVLVSGQLSFSLPMGAVDEESGLQTAYDAITVTPFVSVGKGFSKSYVYTYIGHDFTSNDFNDNLRFGLEYGHKFFNKLWTIAAFNMKEPTKTTDKLQNSRIEETRLFVNNQYYNSLSIKLIYELNDNTGINFSSNLISVRANNLPFRAPLAVGFYKKW